MRPAIYDERQDWLSHTSAVLMLAISLLLSSCSSEESGNAPQEQKTALPPNSAAEGPNAPPGEQENTVADSAAAQGPNPARLTKLGGADEPVFSPDGEKIAFSNSQGGIDLSKESWASSEYPRDPTDIYTMNSDGTGVTNLTKSPKTWDFTPTFSPDGRKIVFHTQKKTYVMNSDGTNLTNLTGDNKEVGSPTFAPNGKKIAFERNQQAIYVMNSDGTNRTRLINTGAANFGPVYSPVGEKIAFTHCLARTPICGIYVMNSDGTNLTGLTGDTPQGGLVHDETPIFSPNGERVAFIRLGARTELYVVNADGTGLTNLSNGLANGLDPTFAPDGKKIAFTGNSQASDEIYKVNVDGSDLTNITNDKSARDSQPAFSPDGKKIAFRSGRYDDTGTYVAEIYLMNLDQRQGAE